MSLHLGDVPAGSTLYIPFTSYGKTNGESITLTGLAVTDIEIYKNGSTTQRSSDNGYALLDTDGIDFDGITGLHGFSVDLSDNTDSGFYAVGSFYWVIVSTVTIHSQTVTFIAATFRIVPAESSAGVPKVDPSHLNGGALSGYNATVKLKQLDVENSAGTAIRAASTGSNGDGIEATGHGTGSGIQGLAGATGSGINAQGGATSGNGILAQGGPDSHAIMGQGGDDVGYGAYMIGGDQGSGMAMVGGASAGHGAVLASETGGGVYSGLHIRTTGVGDGVQILGGDTSGHGVSVTARADGDALHLEAVTNGHGISAVGGATTGFGIDGQARGDNYAGMRVLGGADAAGLLASGTDSGPGIEADGGATGHGLFALGGASGGHGLKAQAQETNTEGIAAEGGATAADTLGFPTATDVADEVLTRDWTSVGAPAARSVLNALRFLRNKWTLSAGTLSVKEEDDSTEAWAATVTTDAAAEPIIGNDPS